MPTTIEAFSVSHAAILDGTTGAETADIYGIREGSVEVDTDSYDNTGDDSVLSTWQWFNFATLTIKSGYIPMDLIATLTGTTLTTSGAVGSETVSMPLWNQASLNQPARPVLIRVPAKTNTQKIYTLDVVLYKCQFAPIALDGPTYKDGMVLTYSAKATMSSVDEKGGALADKSIGRIIARYGSIA